MPVSRRLLPPFLCLHQRLTSPHCIHADYVLSDTTRRSEYDAFRRASGFSNSSSSVPPGGFDTDPEKEQQDSFHFFRSFFSNAQHGGTPFGAAAGAGSSSSSSTSGEQGAGAQPQANYVFSDVFEELLRPEVHRVAPVWKWVGSASGAGLGFILANIPGAIGGAVLGNRLGAIRDAKGKSVGEVFINVGSDQKAEVLKALASKVLGSLG